MAMRQGYKNCCVPQCVNSTSKTPEKVFLSVPKDPAKRRSWCTVMRREHQLSSLSAAYCCEDHFDLEKDLENYMKWKMMPGTPMILRASVLPHKFACQGRLESTVLRKPNKLSISRDRKIVLESALQECQPVPEQQFEPEMDFNPDQPSTSGYQYSVDKSIQVKPECKSKGVYCCIKPEMVDASMMTSKIATVHVGTNTSDTKIKLRVEDVFTDSDIDSSSVTTVSEFQPTSTAGSSESSESIGKNYANTKKKIQSNLMLFLGLPNNGHFLINSLRNHCDSTERDIFICLKKIRWNEPFSILGVDFDLSPSYIGALFRTTLPKLALCLGKFILWPTKTQVFLNQPIPFRSRFSKVSVIIDCFEIEIQKPSDSVKQALTYSDYKKCNTIKYLIGCTPDGTCCYVSPGYGGRASDAEILRESGFLEKLEPGTQVMADRGFKHVERDIIRKGAALVRPPSVASSGALTKDEARLTKQIAALRIHVERVIGRLRHFHLLSPHASIDNKLIGLMDNVVIVACALSNFHSPIIQ